MPVNFINATQQIQLSSFPGTINHNDLITFFTLTEQDKQIVPLQLDTFDLCLSEAYRRSHNQYKEHRRQMDKLINAHNVVLQHIARLIINPAIPDEKLRKIILKDVPENQLMEIIEDPKGIIRPLDGNHLDFFVRRFSYIRKFSPKFLDTLAFRCHPNMLSLLNGIKILKTMNQTGIRKIPDDTPNSFISTAWQPYLKDTENKLYRHYFEMSALWELRNALRSGEIWPENSKRYNDPESYLIPRNKWPKIKEDAEKLLKLPENNKDRIKTRRKELKTCYKIFNQILMK